MTAWDVLLEPLPQGARLLVTGPNGDDLLKAHLPDYPDHPRALLTVLEGLALWCGETLYVAISADTPSSHSLGLGPFGGEPESWPQESALVHFEFRFTTPRGRRLRGFGDFQSLRRLGLYR